MSLASLRQRLVERLRPAADWSPDAVAARSDFDLNPGVRPPEIALRPAAVLVPIVADSDGAQAILTRRSDTLTSHTGQIAFPGGRLDPGETAVEAALREAREEINLPPASVEVLGLGDPYRTGTGFLITPVIGWLAQRPALAPSPGEVAEIFETPWDFLRDAANHERGSLMHEGAERWFWAMPYGERYIWGVTAGILRALRDRLYGGEADADQAAEEDAA